MGRARPDVVVDDSVPSGISSWCCLWFHVHSARLVTGTEGTVPLSSVRSNRLVSPDGFWAAAALLWERLLVPMPSVDTGTEGPLAGPSD